MSDISAAIGPLRARWLASLPAAAPSAAATDAFDEIAAAYREPHRAYHTLEHVVALLRLVEAQRDRFTRADLVDLAVYYHDTVYIIGRPDNEAASARLATERLRTLGLPERDVSRVAALIEATAHGHAAPAGADADRDRFLDFDLSILGSDEPTYRAYAQAIRREYASIPDQLYRAGRARVLRSFLDQPRIYRCNDLAERWERSARDNLAAEIAGLTA